MEPLLEHWPKLLIIFVAGAVVAALFFRAVQEVLLPNSKSRKTYRSRKQSKRSAGRRPDEVILTRRLNDLNDTEYDRLLALYFQNQNGEADADNRAGSIDLVILDRRWHSKVAEQKLKAWGKWRPARKSKRGRRSK